jgi:uncharacterized alpha/beta hydrolase family protein
MNEKYILTVTILTILLTIITSSFFLPANAQNRLPVLLIHGYLNDNSVWEKWVVDLKAMGFKVKAVEFSRNDKCGSVADHAEQLKSIVEKFKTSTRSDKINIVSHSKGGLDARVYLANNPAIDYIANLIMIGTPNAGSPRADNRDQIVIDFANNICFPYPDEAINDLKEKGPTTSVGKNDHTQYHTIAGDWNRSYDTCVPLTIICTDFECRDSNLMVYYQREGNIAIEGPDDGIVPLESVESGDFNSLGHTDNCHTNLFGPQEFNMAMSILRR